MARPLVMTVFGTRPEAIKMAPVVELLRSDVRFDVLVVSTGQHREMLAQVSEILGITPDVDLGIFHQGSTLSANAARVLDRLDPVLQHTAPSVVLVQGDTTTSAAAALAAFHRNIPVAHLEAGLRSRDMTSPFPEEANRQVITRLAALHLTPTPSGRENLVREAVDPGSIVVTGNTVIDALLAVAARYQAFEASPLREVVASDRRIVLVTAHRRENWGPRLESVGRALARLAMSHDDVQFVLPVHGNPHLRGFLLPPLTGISNVTVTEPLDYGEFTHLLARATLVLTDSGGVQEEAPSLSTPVLLLRENTERPEGVSAGTVRMVGTDEDRVVKEVSALLSDPDRLLRMATIRNPYGDGRSAPRVVAAVAHLLGLDLRPADWRSGGSV